jgi:hypothetical protein
MTKLYLARGYNSYTHKVIKRVFKDMNEAQSFCNGLTDPSIKFYNADNQMDAFNLVLRAEATPC